MPCLSYLRLTLGLINHLAAADTEQSLNCNLFTYLFIFALQSPWGVASGAITGRLCATVIAILGGALLANYISEKLVRVCNPKCYL